MLELNHKEVKAILALRKQYNSLIEIIGINNMKRLTIGNPKFEDGLDDEIDIETISNVFKKLKKYEQNNCSKLNH